MAPRSGPEEAHQTLEVRQSDLRALVDISPDPIIVYDLEGRFLFVSRQTAALYGVDTALEFLAEVKTIGELMDAENRRRAYENFAITLAAGTSSRNEYTVHRRDGRSLQVEVHSVVVRDAAGKPLGFLSVVRDITEHKRADLALAASEARFRSMAEQLLDVLYVTDPSSVIRYVSPSVRKVFGREPQEMIGRPFVDFLEESQIPIAMGRYREALAAGVSPSPTVGLLMRRKDGGLFHGEVNASPHFEDGRVTSMIGLIRDVSGREALEEQLRQAQKMESIGRLAGGVAHDFNNLLTAIIGNVSLALADLVDADPLHACLTEVSRAAESAASLTRQLLAFSRKQLFDPRVMNLSEVVADMKGMLRRLIGEHLTLTSALAGDLGPVRIDPHQVEQILVNLCVNARDAMPDGGEIVLETANVRLDAEYCRRHPGAAPGDHVLLAVSDRGCGMDARIKEHLFEPFFTTKPSGKGTGLGLAMVYGAVKQHGGQVEVESEVGRGSTIRIYLPRVDESPEKPTRRQDAGLPRGQETVLLVEDETAVRELAERLLKRQGYRVHAFASGGEALQALEGLAEPVHMLFTDVVLPGMNGRDLAERVSGARPGLRVLFTSGHSDEVIAHHGVLDRVEFIAKPYTASSLARRVREVLDGGREPAPPHSDQ